MALDFPIVLIQFRKENVTFLPDFNKFTGKIIRHGKCFASIREDLTFVNLSHNRHIASFRTRAKPVEHGYVFSMAVGTIWVWWKLVPLFFVRGRTVDSGGRGVSGSYLGRQTP